jgi:hypothetical protein
MPFCRLINKEGSTFDGGTNRSKRFRIILVFHSFDTPVNNSATHFMGRKKRILNIKYILHQFLFLLTRQQAMKPHLCPKPVQSRGAWT